MKSAEQIAREAAAKAVSVETIETSSIGNVYGRLMLAGLPTGTRWWPDGEPPHAHREALAMVIIAAIKEAVADAERVAALAMRDLQIDSEAFHAGWEAGASAMADESWDFIANDSWLKARITSREEFDSLVDIPEPPAHDQNGEPLPPSRLRQRTERLERVLEDIKFVARNAETAPSRMDMLKIQEIAHDALEETP